MQSADELVLLVVEDHPFQRQALVQLLKLLGAKKVLEADNGRPALDIIRHQTEAENPIDLVICDIDMPDMDGLELARRIRGIAPDIRIIMVSGYFYRDDVSIQEAISQGLIIDFISKPFLQAEILRVLET